MKSFMAVGRALLTIRDQRLYREDFKTFKDYCTEKWGILKAHANRLIAGAKVATNLVQRIEDFSQGKEQAPHGASNENFSQAPHGAKIQPTNEYQVRLLAILEPAQQCEVWEEAVRTADGKTVTYKLAKALVTELVGPAPEPNPPSASHSGFASSGPLRRTPFAPLTLTLGCPLPWPWRGCGDPESSRFILFGGGWGCI
jgi:hypothetical protein